MRFIEELELVSFKAITNDKPGTFEAVVACFGNIDRADEVIAKGAFAEILANKAHFPVVWAHQWSDPPIGVSIKTEETDLGLKVKGRLFIEKNQRAAEVHEAMVQGALKEWSFGAGVLKESFEERDGRQVRVLEKLDLIEFGPCLKGVNPNTYTVGLKAAEAAAVAELNTESQESDAVPTNNGQEISTEDAHELVSALFD